MNAYQANLRDENGGFSYWHGLQRTQTYVTLLPSRRSDDSDDSAWSRPREIKRKPLPSNPFASRAASPSTSSIAEAKPDLKPPPQSYRAQTWQYVRKLSLTETWYYEFVAVSISIGAFVASILLLMFQDGRPVHTWNFPVSLNTIVAVLGAVSRATLAFAVGAALGQGKWNWFKRGSDQLSRFDCFEEASRGPWGSVRLLFSTGRDWTTLGALAMVIMLGFEAFLQAIVNYEGQLRLMDTGSAAAFLHRNERLDTGYYQPCLDKSCPASIKLPVNGSSIRDAVNIPSWGSYPHVSLMSAFYKGLDHETPFVVDTYSCPSGNCTYPRYTSLGFCSKCNDISSSIVKTVASGGEVDAATNTTTATQTWNEYSLPYVSMSDKTKDLTIAHGVLDAWRTVSFQDMSTMVMAFGILSRDQDDQEPVAAECAISMCASLYETVVQDGVVDEVRVQSWDNREDRSWEIQFPSKVPSDWDFPGISDWTSILGWYSDEEREVIASWDDATNHSVAQRANNFLRSDLQIAIPESDATKYNLGGSEETPTRFNFSQATIASTLTWLGNGMANELVFYSIRNGSYGRNTDLAYWEAGNYTAGFERLATVLSAWARTESGRTPPESDAQAVAGEVYQWMLITRVSWPFLALPAIAMTLGLTYFILVLLDTKKLGLRPWKGSTLAMLAMGLDGESRRQLRDASGKHGFEESGRGIRVFFHEDGGKGHGCGELRGEESAV